jgi:TolB-like protein/DNA-binding winged helix-turn-helix (wHTH) protein/Flp pilus assembly protein TadD
MPDPDPPPLAFDGFVLDVAGRRLLRDGATVGLEPKAFDVLALLAGTPGRAFTRDEILDAVWGHRHVTPGVLNRIMTLLRHALGEDAHAPRYLHTLHGVGYRFDLRQPEARAAGDASTPEPRTDPLPEGADVRPAPAPRPRAAMAPRWRASGLAFLAVLLAGVAWWSTRPAATPEIGASPVAGTPPVAAPAKAPRLIVVPLEPIGSLPATRDIAAGLSDELITALARIHGLRVIARESTGLAVAGPRDLPSLVRQLQVTHALEGSLSQSGEKLRMRLRLLDVRDGSAVWSQDYDRDAADVLALQQDVARAVADALALELGLATAAPRGGDADFLRRYYAARAVLVAPQTGRGPPIEQAEVQLRALLRERPEDARVRASLASALDMRAFFAPDIAAALRAEAAQEAALALQADPRLPDALRVQATAAYRESRWEDCIRLFEAADRYGPNESRPRFSFAMAWANLGYLDRAEAIMRERMEAEPLSSMWRFGLGRVLDTQGRHEEARRVLPPASGNNGPYAVIFNAIWLGDLDAASAIAATMEQDARRGDTYVVAFKPSYVAVIRALGEPAHWPEARRVLDASERDTGLMNFLRVFDPQARPADLIRGLVLTRERAYSSWDLLLWTRDLAHIRRDPAFDAYLRDAGILAYWKKHGFPPQCRPAGTGAACD